MFWRTSFFFAYYVSVDTSAVMCGVPASEDIISKVRSIRVIYRPPLFQLQRTGLPLYKVLAVTTKHKRHTAIAGLFKHEIVGMPYGFPVAVAVEILYVH